MYRSLIAAALLSAFLPGSLSATTLEGRVRRLENILNNQRGSELLLELQRLRQEVQRLRGQVEEQGFQLKRLEQRQRDQYLDLERRLGQSASPPVSSDAPNADTQPQAPAFPQPDRGAGSTSPEQVLYRRAFDLLKQRRYSEAIAGFEKQLRQYPRGRFAGHAQYWLGEIAYVRRDRSKALLLFQELLNQYPDSPKVPGALLRIGVIQEERGNVTRARAVFEELIRRFPGTPEARSAQARLGMTRGTP